MHYSMLFRVAKHVSSYLGNICNPSTFFFLTYSLKRKVDDRLYKICHWPTFRTVCSKQLRCSKSSYRHSNPYLKIQHPKHFQHASINGYSCKLRKCWWTHLYWAQTQGFILSETMWAGKSPGRQRGVSIRTPDLPIVESPTAIYF